MRKKRRWMNKKLTTKMVSKKATVIIFLTLAALVFSGVFYFFNHIKNSNSITRNSAYNLPAWQDLTSEEREFRIKLVDAAVERTTHQVVYDPAYVAMDYPNGDVPENQGVCADVVVRIYRELGIDLQKEVHEDMTRNFDLYPRIWKLEKPDSNIDHRRVQNLMIFFERYGQVLPITKNVNDYLPGDIIVWEFGLGRKHIGMTIDELSNNGQKLLIVHNIGRGPKKDDVLFRWKIIGHYRYFEEGFGEL